MNCRASARTAGSELNSRIDSGRGGVYTEKAGENGPFVAHGCELLHLLFER